MPLSFYVITGGNTFGEKRKIMVVLIKDVVDYMFSSALDKIVFSTDQASALFRLSLGDREIISETYVPDANGKISVLDLQDLVEPYLVSNLIEQFSYQITDAAGASINKNFVVQFCAAEASLDAKPFMGSYFLTALMGEKVTSTGRKEFLHLVVFEATAVSASCMYLTASGYQTKIKSLDNITDLNKVVTVDVSPENFTDDVGDLFYYTIHAGNRSQSFQMDLSCPDAAPCLLFTNSFGCQETIYCTGTHTLSPEFERNSTMIDGKLHHFLIEEKRVFEANTGVLNTGMALWADELFRSKEIYLLEGSRIGKEIVITESESLRTNDLDAMPTFTFEYRYAQRNQNILQLPQAGRVFDNTFDNTFE